jgi:hypothetical protein
MCPTLMLCVMKNRRRESTQCLGHALVGNGEAEPPSIDTIHTIHLNYNSASCSNASLVLCVPELLFPERKTRIFLDSTPFSFFWGGGRHAVAQLVVTQSYKPAGHGFDSVCCYWDFSFS